MIGGLDKEGLVPVGIEKHFFFSLQKMIVLEFVSYKSAPHVISIISYSCNSLFAGQNLFDSSTFILNWEIIVENSRIIICIHIYKLDS